MVCVGAVGLGSRSLVPLTCVGSVSLFIPNDRADLGGFGGACSAGGGNFLDDCCGCWGLAGLLGGKAGVWDCAGGTSLVATEQLGSLASTEDLPVSSSLYPGNAFAFSMSEYLASTCPFVLFGGRVGREDGSKTGAFTLP